VVLTSIYYLEKMFSDACFVLRGTEWWGTCPLVYSSLGLNVLVTITMNSLDFFCFYDVMANLIFYNGNQQFGTLVVI
jgi:hypothetical protein